MHHCISRVFLPAVLCTLSTALAVASTTAGNIIDLTQSNIGYMALGIFVIAYIVVMSEEFIHLRNSKSVILATGIIRGMIAFVYAGQGDGHSVETALRHNLLEFSELSLFLLAAMTYVNAMDG